jgi:nicotinamidase-related amidase
MLTGRRALLHIIAAVAGIASCIVVETPQARTIIDEWASVKAPPPPVLKPVTIDRKTTALLMLDFNQQTCNLQRRPRCIASIPKVKTFLAAARAAGVPVIYSVGGGGKRADIAKDLAPASDDPVVSGGVDKFVGTDLEKLLKERGVTTVIIVGTAANGAIIYTASGAAMRGMKVIIPVDGVSADTLYAEQYTAWHLVNAPLVSAAVTLTSLDAVTF